MNEKELYEQKENAIDFIRTYMQSYFYAAEKLDVDDFYMQSEIEESIKACGKKWIILFEE